MFSVMNVLTLTTQQGVVFALGFVLLVSYVPAVKETLRAYRLHRLFLKMQH